MSMADREREFLEKQKMIQEHMLPIIKRKVGELKLPTLSEYPNLKVFIESLCQVAIIIDSNDSKELENFFKVVDSFVDRHELFDEAEVITNLCKKMVREASRFKATI